jgi:transcriptional regulator with XRE-family HTH domain
MAEEKLKTDELLNRLTKTGSINRFIKRYGEYMESVPFHEYIAGLCEEKGITPAIVIERSGIERTFGHQLFNGRRNPSRDKVIQLAFGFGMNVDETRILLQTAGKSALYPRIKRDAVVIYALEKGLSFGDVQETLSELSIPMIGKEGRNV